MSTKKPNKWQMEEKSGENDMRIDDANSKEQENEDPSKDKPAAEGDELGL